MDGITSPARSHVAKWEAGKARSLIESSTFRAPMSRPEEPRPTLPPMSARFRTCGTRGCVLKDFHLGECVIGGSATANSERSRTMIRPLTPTEDPRPNKKAAFPSQLALHKEHRVSKLLARRIKNCGKCEYAVRWEGVGPAEDTWEKEQNIRDRQLIAEFDRAPLKAPWRSRVRIGRASG